MWTPLSDKLLDKQVKKKDSKQQFSDFMPLTIQQRGTNRRSAPIRAWKWNFRTGKEEMDEESGRQTEKKQ